mmetsp:Transcript_17753/g.16027  ORF Transcript_17753/g.16027 Transcript_17753/m.16027 type:complete len:490 (+) Transcript_17753:74-1543(+)
MEDNRLLKLEELVTSLSNELHQLKSPDTRSLSRIDSFGPDFSSGDTAWMLTSTALVLFMTMPGLALFYAGMVRSKNVLATVMQSFAITCLITFLWLCYGYSISFGPISASNTTPHPVYGSGDRTWLNGMTVYTVHQLAPTIPESVFCMYQLTFAIITAALITGSFADRMRFGPMLIFITIWHTVVYCPVAHSVWHPQGFLFQSGALDYAGGDVVHICSGISGLTSAIYLGHRKGYGKAKFEPSNILITFIGMAMLWVGWFGFNAGSAVAANGRAGMAMLITHISASVASLSWMATEWIVTGKPSVAGMASGAIAGLVVVTPMSGYVDQTAAFIGGLLGGPFCYFGAQIKHYFGYDDSLDAFGVHATGGILGGILCGFFANPYISGQKGVFYSDTYYGGRQLGEQIYAIVVTIGWSAFATLCILFLVDKVVTLRVSEQEEEDGLDHSLHGETLSNVTIAKKLESYDAVKSNEGDGKSVEIELTSKPVDTV